jgi:hypothetical protein
MFYQGGLNGTNYFKNIPHTITKTALKSTKTKKTINSTIKQKKPLKMQL